MEKCDTIVRISVAPRTLPCDMTKKMTPRPLDLGPITTLSNLGKFPYVRMILAWTMFALLLIAVFWLLHGGFNQVKDQWSLMMDWFHQNG